MNAPKLSISFEDPETNTKATLAVQFTEAEWAILMRYCEDCERIAESNALKDFRVNINVSGEKGKPVEWNSTIPDDDKIAVILHRLRPFVLNDEPTNFNKVCNILKRQMNHPFLRSVVDYQRNEFSGKNFQEQSKIQLDGDLVINANERLMEWLNSKEYHRDREKSKAIDAINHALPNNFLKAILCSMLIDKVHAIIAIGNLIVAMKLGEGKEVLTTSTIPAKSRKANSD